MPIIKDNPVLRETAHTLLPLIWLYALYVQFHGELGPGGGFQAGVIFAVGFIIYGLIYGFDRARQFLSPRTAEYLACGGLLLFAGVGAAGLLLGGNFLDYNQLAGTPITGQHIGIALIELGVGIGIVGVFVAVFYSFTESL